MNGPKRDSALMLLMASGGLISAFITICASFPLGHYAVLRIVGWALGPSLRYDSLADRPFNEPDRSHRNISKRQARRDKSHVFPLGNMAGRDGLCTRFGSKRKTIKRGRACKAFIVQMTFHLAALPPCLERLPLMVETLPHRPRQPVFGIPAEALETYTAKFGVPPQCPQQYAHPDH